MGTVDMVVFVWSREHKKEEEEEEDILQARVKKKRLIRVVEIIVVIIGKEDIITFGFCEREDSFIRVYI